MHTMTPTPAACDGHDVRFHHNQDLSGDVIIVVGKQELRVPGAALLEFIADHVRNRRISELEQMDAGEVLGTIV
jgi:hypothetical protein